MRFALAALGLLALQASHRCTTPPTSSRCSRSPARSCRMGLTFSENLALVDRSRQEALTDPLTGLGNRRRLLPRSRTSCSPPARASPGRCCCSTSTASSATTTPSAIPLGDALLARLGAKLAAAVEPEGRPTASAETSSACSPASRASRWRRSPATRSRRCRSAAGASTSPLPTGASCFPPRPQERPPALALVDERLYANKRSRQHLRRARPAARRAAAGDGRARARPPRAPARGRDDGARGRAAHGPRRRGPRDHGPRRRAPRRRQGRGAGRDPPEARSLDPAERAIIERHSEVGERILAAAPAMGPVARLVRSSHERYDGRGYPDRRSGRGDPHGRTASSPSATPSTR